TTVGAAAHGNFWDDVASLAIFDTDYFDGFGDYGSQYPYSAFRSGNVSSNVVDWGPMTNKTPEWWPIKACYVVSSAGKFNVTQNLTGAPNSATEVESGASACIKITASDVIIDCNNKTITNDGTSNAFGVVTTAGLTNITFMDCPRISQYYSGIYLYRTNDSSVMNNTVFNSTGHSMRLLGSSNNTILNNTFNDTSGGYGLHVDSGSLYNNITWNEVFNVGEGIWINQSSSNTFMGNSLHDNTDGFVLYSQSDLNLLHNNTVRDNSGTGFELGSGCDDNTFRNNTIHDGQHGFTSSGSSRNTFVNNTIYDLTGRGMQFTGSSDNIITDNVVRDSKEGFAALGGSDSNNFTRNTAYGLANNGFHISGSSGCLLESNNAYNASQNGIHLSSSSDNNNLTLNTVENSTMVGIDIEDSDDNHFTNNTIRTDPYGVYIDSSSTGNVFAYNGFYSSSILHAYAGVAGNFFNISVGPCGAYCARGNYWSGIESLDIFDTDRDGFGNWGDDYPYNAANGGLVSGNVTDEGPITSREVKAPDENLSLTIHGINGTEVTGSRNVELKMTYNFSAARACRWANDDASNLTAAPWEPCTMVHAWILSNGTGNKTVYMEITYQNGTTENTSDWIMYWYIQDYTPPTDPVVYDGLSGDDIDWWNSNTTLQAHWTATEDISMVYYRYRIIDNSSCYNNDCNWTDAGAATSVTVANLTLEEGRNYSFEVIAYNPFNLSSSAMTSDGVVIDMTGPGTPVVSSTTHPTQTLPYPSARAIFNWTTTDASLGIEGYSYVLNRLSGTNPDNILEERYWETLAYAAKGSYNQTLKINGTGEAFAVFSQVKSNFSVNNTVR
ncbi:NosD domain-containing protein, partial [Nanoarchaeota archaeon]